MLLTSDPEQRYDFSVMMLRRTFPLFFSIPIALLVIVVSMCGLLIPGFYSRETLNWQAQSIGQDMADVFLVVPVFLFSSWFAYRGNNAALLVWAGTVLYLLYTFLIYCFGVHFNMLFPVYCATLGLSFYAIMYFIYRQQKERVTPDRPNKTLATFTGVYFIFIGVLFYLLWLWEIIPAILDHTIPASLAAVGLPTNAVHVIDLSVFLPGLIITGIMLLKHRSLGYLLAPMLLTFFVLMDITIGGLMIVLRQSGMEADIGVAAVMGVLALFSLVLLIFHLGQFRVQKNAKGNGHISRFKKWKRITIH